MQLNHLDLSVSDVGAASAFLCRHFGFALLQTKGQQGMAVLAGEGGFVLVLTRVTQGLAYPKTFHVGFLVPEAAQVADKHAELEAASVVVSPLQDMRGGPCFYCRTEWGFMLEVSWRAQH
ncbi:MAG: VOC family protein [Massilia sp.]